MRINGREYVLTETKIGGCEKKRPSLILLNRILIPNQRKNKKMNRKFKGIKLNRIIFF